MRIKKFLTVFIFLHLSLSSWAVQDTIPSRPVPHKQVNDFANLLTETRRTEALEFTLQKFKDSLDVEIICITIQSLPTNDAETFAKKLADKWEDEHEKEIGIIILYDDDDREYQIIPGKKFASKFDRIIVSKIESHYLKPNFKKEKYYEGFTEASTAIINHITGNLTDQTIKSDDSFHIYIIVLIIFIFFLIVFPLYLYKKVGKMHFGSKRLEFYSAFMLIAHLHPSQSTYQDFTKGKGQFSIPGGSNLTSYGGGAYGRW